MESDVTPYAGVWIEISSNVPQYDIDPVTPYAGVWIEILSDEIGALKDEVTPYAGVWIEMRVYGETFRGIQSLPTRECGLK